jgi:hypothetical protein
MLTSEGVVVDRDLLLSKADTLDLQIKQLTAMRNGLRDAAACKAPSHFECPTFLRLLKMTGSPRFKSPRQKLKPK